MSGGYARITASSYNLLHCPELSFRHGSTPEAERAARPESEYLEKLANSMRSFEEAAAYPPNQAFIGNLDPLELPERPWSGEGSAAHKGGRADGGSSGRFGDIIEEKAVLGLLKLSDSFDLVILESGFAADAKAALQKLPVLKEFDLSKFDQEISTDRIEDALAEHALPLYFNGRLAGCVKAAHPDDVSLCAHVIFENLSSKAGAVYSVLKLLELSSTDPAEIDYIIETSEEACGDANQRGGGNFAKAVGELAGLVNATGSDTRSFCAGPIHGILQAASLVKAGTFKKVIVAAGGATAKLAMNSKKHIEKGFPMLEDCLGAYAMLIEAPEPADGKAEDGIIIRNDIIGVHRIGSGSSPQNVIQNLVADPLEKAGMKFDEIDYYAPELHNPEITEAGGAGNVTLANLKMIAAMAVMKNQIERADINTFIEAHGSAGWAPTQGHIPSGIPAVGWIADWMKSGKIRNSMIIGKGSLFLGRMTGLFDGVSILLENPRPKTFKSEPAAERPEAVLPGKKPGELRIGLTIPGSESGADELLKGASAAEESLPGLKVVAFGTENSDPREAHRMMEKALEDGEVDAAVTFHYPFPIGTATVGLTKAPGSGGELFIASTTGVSDTNRVNALIKNALAGIAAAKARGIKNPSVGILNVDGARGTLIGLKQLKAAGYGINLVKSSRGDELLRGNDILAGTADVIVCDTLSGNAFIKILASYSTGGALETSGAGYGPGLGAEALPVSIISRASGAPAVAAAILYSAGMISGNLKQIYSDELAAAEKAGVEAVYRKNCSTGGAAVQPEPSADAPVKDAGGPAPRPVDTEIDGIDVLMLDEAVSLLKNSGIYCEAGMGCTGPVVMLAGSDAEIASGLLRKNGIIGEDA